jgi:hypothetical protein
MLEATHYINRRGWYRVRWLGHTGPVEQYHYREVRREGYGYTVCEWQAGTDWPCRRFEHLEQVAAFLQETVLLEHSQANPVLSFEQSIAEELMLHLPGYTIVYVSPDVENSVRVPTN